MFRYEFFRKPIRAHYLLSFLGAAALVMFALHWVHLSADPSWKMGLLTGRDWAGDFFTDEGWEAKSAIRTILVGGWHAPGELNLAVMSPLWPAILYVPFRLFGVTIEVARSVAMLFYAGSALAAFALVRRIGDLRDAVLVFALLSVNVLGFTFGRAALVEPVFLFFVLAGLLMALYAADSDRLTMALLAGFVLSLALVAKLSAIFALVPFATLFWLRAKKERRVTLLLAALANVALMPLLQHFFLLARYPLEQQGYLQINVTDRKVVNLHQFAIMVAKVLFGMRAVGPFLLLCLLLGTLLAITWRNWSKHDVLLQIGWVWLSANLAIFTTIRYFPPRYCLSLLFPITILAVRYANAIGKRHRYAAAGLYLLLGCSLVVDAVQDVRYLFHPHYTMMNMAREVAERVPMASRGMECPVMSFMGDTLSLYTQLPAANSLWGTQPRWKRIERCNPQIFLTRGDVDGDIEEQFRKAGRMLVFERDFKALAGLAGDKPERLYRVKEISPH